MRHGSRARAQVRRGPLWQALGILSEVLFTLAAICALYIVWQMWWTGVQAERTQAQTRQQVRRVTRRCNRKRPNTAI